MNLARLNATPSGTEGANDLTKFLVSMISGACRERARATYGMLQSWMRFSMEPN